MGCCGAKPASAPVTKQTPLRARRHASDHRRGVGDASHALVRDGEAQPESPRNRSRLGLYNDFNVDATVGSDDAAETRRQLCVSCGATTWVSALTYCPKQLKVRVVCPPPEANGNGASGDDDLKEHADATAAPEYEHMTVAEFHATARQRRHAALDRRYGAASKDNRARGAAVVQEWWRRARMVRRWFRVLFMFTYKKLEKWQEKSRLQAVDGPAPIQKAMAVSPAKCAGVTSLPVTPFGQIPSEWPAGGLANESDEVKGATVQTLLGLVASGEVVPLEFVQCLLAEAEQLLKAEPNVQRCALPPGARCVVVGDVHGQLVDLLQILREYDLPNASRVYVFNGDWVDRGTKGCEVLVLILTLYVCYSDYVYLNRGNHEDVAMCENYEFRHECHAKYNPATFGWFARIFRALPLCTVVQSEVFVCHGGLPRDAVTLADIDKINRFRDIPMVGLGRTRLSGGTSPNSSAAEQAKRIIADIVWSDPIEESQLPRGVPKNVTYLPNGDRGNGVWFRVSHTEQFLRRNGLRLVIRSHEAQDAGFSLAHDSMVVTVFSASYYAGVQRNDAAVAVISLKSDAVAQQLSPTGAPQKIQGAKTVVEFDTWRVYCEYDFFLDALSDEGEGGGAADDPSVYPVDAIADINGAAGDGAGDGDTDGTDAVAPEKSSRPVSPLKADSAISVGRTASDDSSPCLSPNSSSQRFPKVLRSSTPSLSEMDEEGGGPAPTSVRQLDLLLSPRASLSEVPLLHSPTRSPKALQPKPTTRDEVPSVVREVLSVMHDFVHNHRHRLMSVFSSSEAACARTGAVSPQEWANAMREVSGCQEVPWGFLRPWIAEARAPTSTTASTVCYPVFVRRFTVPLEDRLFRKWAPSLVQWLWSRARWQYADPAAMFRAAVPQAGGTLHYQRFFHLIVTDMQTHLPSDVIFSLFTHFDKNGTPGFLMEAAWVKAFAEAASLGVPCDQYEEDLDGLMSDWVVSPNTYFMWDHWLAQRLRALIQRCITPRAAFELLDVDGNGVVDLHDLRHTTNRLGSNRLQYPGRQVVYSFAKESLAEVTDEDVRVVAELYGTTAEDVRARMQEVGGGHPVQATLQVWPLRDAQLESFLKSIDYDGDGEVSYADFERAFFVVDLHPHASRSAFIEGPLVRKRSSRTFRSPLRGSPATPETNNFASPNKALAQACASFRRVRQRSGCSQTGGTPLDVDRCLNFMRKDSFRSNLVL